MTEDEFKKFIEDDEFILEESESCDEGLELYKLAGAWKSLHKNIFTNLSDFDIVHDLRWTENWAALSLADNVFAVTLNPDPKIRIQDRFEKMTAYCVGKKFIFYYIGNLLP